MKYERLRALVITLFVLAPAGLTAITGEEIAENIEARESGSTTHALVQMVLTDENGIDSERTIEQYGAETASGLQRNVIIFHEPASVKDTRFLTVENEDRDEDQWIFLPALQRVRRISSGDRDGSFMGTDFTYGDLTYRSIDDYRHTLLREEPVQFVSGGGAVTRTAYVVDVVPLPGTDSQYSRTVEWVDPVSWTPIRTEIYGDNGDLLKINTVGRLEQVQGYWTVIENSMENVETGHSTRLSVQRYVYNQELPTSLFTTNFLQTGRP